MSKMDCCENYLEHDDNDGHGDDDENNNNDNNDDDHDKGRKKRCNHFLYRDDKDELQDKNEKVKGATASRTHGTSSALSSDVSFSDDSAARKGEVGQDDGNHHALPTTTTVLKIPISSTNKSAKNAMNSVYFSDLKHKPTQLWRDTIKIYSQNRDDYPKWSDEIFEHVITDLSHKGIDTFFVNQREDKNKRRKCDSWSLANGEEILKRTKQRFKDDRKLLLLKKKKYSKKKLDDSRHRPTATPPITLPAAGSRTSSELLCHRSASSTSNSSSSSSGGGGGASSLFLPAAFTAESCHGSAAPLSPSPPQQPLHKTLARWWSEVNSAGHYAMMPDDVVCARSDLGRFRNCFNSLNELVVDESDLMMAARDFVCLYDYVCSQMEYAISRLGDDEHTLTDIHHYLSSMDTEWTDIHPLPNHIPQATSMNQLDDVIDTEDLMQDHMTDSSCPTFGVSSLIFPEGMMDTRQDKHTDEVDEKVVSCLESIPAVIVTGGGGGGEGSVQDDEPLISSGDITNDSTILTSLELDDVCFQSLDHQGTVRWLAVVKRYSDTREKYPEWSDTICFQVQEELRRRENSTRFLMPIRVLDDDDDDDASNQRTERTNRWRKATDEEILERTRTVFNDRRRSNAHRIAALPDANDVCFQSVEHKGTFRWLELIKNYSENREEFPDWSDEILKRIQDQLASENITRYLIPLNADGTVCKRIRPDRWYVATDEEVLERTKQRFLDFRKVVTELAPSSSQAVAEKPFHRLANESSAPPSNYTEKTYYHQIPKPNDVCFRSLNHSGTVRWREVIELFADRREEFPVWTDSICHRVREQLAMDNITRFLVPVGVTNDQRRGGRTREEWHWCIATEKEILDRTKMVFEDHRMFASQATSHYYHHKLAGHEIDAIINLLSIGFSEQVKV